MRFEPTRRLACAALALLAACTMYSDPTQDEANIISPSNFRAGSGQITQVGVLPNKRPAGDGSGERNLYRLYLRMDPPAGTQSVDVDRDNFMAGEYVELTNDGRVVRVSGSTLNEARSSSP
jgi:hypothetical protein